MLQQALPPDSRKGSRDASLDGLRALAILRVITWHASGWAWTTWVISSVPAMFAVSGALLSRSYSSNGIISSLQKRFKRLLPPLWLYCGLVLAISWRAHVNTSGPWTFFFPLQQPKSLIASEWFTSALWYIRAYIWVLLFSPIIYFAVQKARSIIPSIGMVTVVLLGWKSIDTSSAGWIVGDVVLYATCTAAGMAWLSANRPEPSRLRLTSIAFLVCTTLWLLLRDSSTKIVNNDHVLHLFVGGFWISILLLAPQVLSAFASTRPAQFLNRFPLTVYLWHSAIAWGLWQLLPQRYPHALRGISVVILTVLFLPVATYTAGLVEKHPPKWMSIRLITSRFSLLALVALALNFGPVDFRASLIKTNLNQPLPPSAAPKIIKIEIDKSVQEFLDASKKKNVQWEEREEALQAILERHDRDRRFGGTRAIVISPNGKIWHGTTSGAKPFDQPSLIGSLTKTFTTTLIMRLVEKGELLLDDPVGDLGMGFTHRQVTVRQLLTQSSGMPKYKTQSGSVQKGTTISDVIHYISKQPLRFSPGTDIEYSTTGFAVLGVLLEQKTGVSFDELLKEEIAEPLKYNLSTFVGDFGSIGFSTGGIIISMDDLANWASRYFYSRNTTAQPWAWSIKKTTGVGAHGYCPCENGNFMALGHIGGRTFASVDGDGTVVVIDTLGVLVNENYEDTQVFAQELRLVAGGGKNPLYK